MQRHHDMFSRVVHQAAFHDEGYGFDVFGMHPPSLARVAVATWPIYARYFRVDSVGARHIPPRGPAMLVANHGGIVPIDGAMLWLDVLQTTEPPRIPRIVADHFVPRVPLASTLFARLGVVNGTRTNVRHLLERGELVASFPEGVSGPAKRSRDRYQIQDWRVGFAELAMRYRAPVVPVAILGAEESWPLLGKLGAGHLFGAPYVPIPRYPLPLPAHYRIRYGRAITLAGDADDPVAVANAAGEVRSVLERMIADARAARRGVFR